MKLSKEEMDLIKKKREEEDKNTACMEATLKEDLYAGEYAGYNCGDADAHCCFSEARKEEIINNVRKSFKMVLKKGSKFSGFKEEDGTLSWYDDEGYGIEQAGGDFAEKFLENIKPIKKTRNK